MHICMDVRKYYDYGIGTYIQNLLKQYDTHSSEVLTLFAEPGSLRAIASAHRAHVVSSSSAKYSIAELFAVAVQVNRIHADVFHEPHYTQPFNVKCRKVVTIHDLIHIEFPEYFSHLQRMYARLVIQHACSSADAIIVDSDFMKSELLRRFRVSDRKVHTIHLGVSRDVFASAQPDDEFFARHGIREKYVLYTGSVKPHKNLGVLVRAFGMLKERNTRQLVFCGEDPFSEKRLVDSIRATGIQHSVVVLGRVSQHELAQAYRSARCVVLPSLYEGFGLSLVEAMAAGTAVIGANSASIPEILGDGGILFDPHSPEELAQTLQRVLDDDNLHRELAVRGAERAKQFTWKGCAEQTMELYGRIL